MRTERDLLESRLSLGPTTNSVRHNYIDKASNYTADRQLKQASSMQEITRANNTTEIKKCKGAIDTDVGDKEGSGSNSQVSFC